MCIKIDIWGSAIKWIRVHIHIHACIPIYSHTHKLTHTYTHINLQTYTHMYIYSHTYIHTCTYTYIQIHTYTHTYIYTHKCTDSHAHIHIQAHRLIYTYIHMHTGTHLQVLHFLGQLMYSRVGFISTSQFQFVWLSKERNNLLQNKKKNIAYVEKSACRLSNICVLWANRGPTVYPSLA